MTKEIIWKINVSSTVENNTFLSKEDLLEVLDSNNHPFISEFYKTSLDKGVKQFSEHPVAVWQLTKSHEIRNLFYENLVLDYSPTHITISTSFEVLLPAKWKNRDVQEWSEGMNMLCSDYLFLAGERIVNNDFNKTQYNNVLLLFRNDKDNHKNSIIWNQKTKITNEINERRFTKEG